MVGEIWVTYFSHSKMACTEFSSDKNFYIKRWNFIVLFHFENRQVFLLHPVPWSVLFIIYTTCSNIQRITHEVYVFTILKTNSDNFLLQH